jgi:hypothetical protein
VPTTTTDHHALLPATHHHQEKIHLLDPKEAERKDTEIRLHDQHTRLLLSFFLSFPFFLFVHQFNLSFLSPLFLSFFWTSLPLKYLTSLLSSPPLPP